MSEDAQPALATETSGTQLVSPWSWWYSPRGRNSKPDASGNYELNLTKLGDVKTLEEFFSYYCFLKKPSEVPIDHKILFFEKDAIPAWEVFFYLTDSNRTGQRVAVGFFRSKNVETPTNTT
jgi:hypothetical protein